ncbi:MAG: endonuclease/exonuclease/phosphatase family protein [Actinomycetota bacterium]
MRVVTWNLWWRFGPWAERQPAIEAELRACGPDVALLQEVWADDDADQAEQLAAACGMHVLRTRRQDGDPQHFGNAVLSRHPLTELESITLSGEDGRPSHRSALAARVDAGTGPWVVIVTHLAWQYDKSELRQRQLAEVVALARRHGAGDDEGPPVLLGGDFNATPESDEIRRLTGLAPVYEPGLVFTDCWAAVGEGPGHTWVRDNPNSADALWPRRRLDYLFVAWPRPKPLGNPLAAELIGVVAHDGVVGSDHYGVLATFDTRPGLEEQR